MIPQKKLVTDTILEIANIEDSFISGFRSHMYDKFMLTLLHKLLCVLIVTIALYSRFRVLGYNPLLDLQCRMACFVGWE